MGTVVQKETLYCKLTMGRVLGVSWKLYPHASQKGLKMFNYHGISRMECSFPKVLGAVYSVYLEASDGHRQLGRCVG